MARFNSNNFSMFSIKYLQKQPTILEKPYSIFSYGWCCTFLTNLHNKWFIFCEEFLLANDRSNTWLSVSSSAVRTGAYPYWICTNRIKCMNTNCTQVRSCLRINILKPNDIYIYRTAALTSRRYTLNIYSTSIRTEYFKHAA